MCEKKTEREREKERGLQLLPYGNKTEAELQVLLKADIHQQPEKAVYTGRGTTRR